VEALGIGHIGPKGSPANFGDDGIQRLLIAANDDDMATACGEAVRDSSADTGRSPRYDRNLAFQF
jgi:hypothetical protein